MRKQIRVTPSAKRTALIQEGEVWRFYTPAPADKEKANKALLIYLKKELGWRARMVAGQHAREKVVEIGGNV